MELADAAAWRTNWAWGMPLILLTTVIHVLGLGLINERMAHTLRRRVEHRRFTSLFAAGMSVVVLLATILHGFEAALWALAYVWPGRPARRQDGNALLAERPNQLRPRQCVPGAALADVGRAGVAQRHVAVRADHGLSLLHNRARVAARQPGIAPTLMTVR